jgi:hypothetical protein
MAARIEDHFMTAEYNERAIATARYSSQADRLTRVTTELAAVAVVVAAAVISYQGRPARRLLILGPVYR